MASNHTPHDRPHRHLVEYQQAGKDTPKPPTHHQAALTANLWSTSQRGKPEASTQPPPGTSCKPPPTLRHPAHLIPSLSPGSPRRVLVTIPITKPDLGLRPIPRTRAPRHLRWRRLFLLIQVGRQGLKPGIDLLAATQGKPPQAGVATLLASRERFSKLEIDSPALQRKLETPASTCTR